MNMEVAALACAWGKSMTMRNFTLWMYWRSRTGGMISWRFCVTSRRALWEKMTEGMSQLHIFADLSKLACCGCGCCSCRAGERRGQGNSDIKVTNSKRNTLIARLGFRSGRMAANMAKNLGTALHRWPIKSTTSWMDRIVALYWITNPGKGWKVFVANRVKKIAETNTAITITWKCCSSDLNLADLVKMERGNWFAGPG